MFGQGDHVCSTAEVRRAEAEAESENVKYLGKVVVRNEVVCSGAKKFMPIICGRLYKLGN